MSQHGSSKPRQMSSWSYHPGLFGGIARFWQRSYAPDYLGFVLLAVAYLLIQFFVTPFHRMFSLDDLSKSYPYALIERVPVVWNVVYAGLLPLVILVLWALILRPGTHQAHVTILGLLISVALASFLTDVVKNAVGRTRPDLIARCRPAKGTPEHSLVTIAVCTQTNLHILHDGWRSFPSGHSGFSFSGLGYLALFFAGQMHIFRPRTDLARVLIALSPLLGAALIAISRLEDYRHDVYDVTFGSILGMSMAYFSYRRYYPALRSAKCDEPFPSRADFVLSSGSGKLKDEEEQIRIASEYSLAEGDEDVSETHPLNDTSVGRA